MGVARRFLSHLTRLSHQNVAAWRGQHWVILFRCSAPSSLFALCWAMAPAHYTAQRIVYDVKRWRKGCLWFLGQTLLMHTMAAKTIRVAAVSRGQKEGKRRFLIPECPPQLAKRMSQYLIFPAHHTSLDTPSNPQCYIRFRAICMCQVCGGAAQQVQRRLHRISR